jgi:hypothetical protein
VPVASRVFGEIVADYVKQRQEDPESADRSLLAQARQQLEERLNDAAPLDPETVRSGDRLLSLIGEDELHTALMRRYLTQSLSVSEEAWARFFLVNSLSSAGRSEEVVAEQDVLYHWVAALPPADLPRLSREWPFLPVADTDTVTETYPQDALLLWTHYIPEAPDHWAKIGRWEDWFRRFEEILDATPATEANRQQRFYLLRSALRILFNLRETEQAEALLQRVEALAHEETDPLAVFHWRGHALYLRLRQSADDSEALQQLGSRAAVLLSLYEQALTEDNPKSETARRFSILRDNIASVAADHGLYTLAVPLLTAQIMAGNGTAWNYVRLAMCVWATTHDMTETLRLLRQGAIRTEKGSLWYWVKTRPVFADVAEDPEFVAAGNRR